MGLKSVLKQPEVQAPVKSRLADLTLVQLLGHLVKGAADMKKLTLTTTLLLILAVSVLSACSSEEDYVCGVIGTQGSKQVCIGSNDADYCRRAREQNGTCTP